MNQCNLSDNAQSVLELRYLREGEKNWEDVCKRVANFIGTDSSESNKFFLMMYRRDFIPNSPTLMNAGTEIGQLSACFVLPVGDSMEEIFDAIKWTALIHKTGGGTGFDFSNLRSAGSTVGSTKGVASGPLSFMEVFNAATETVKQGGRRRGANMGILRYDHPDIEKFITAKHIEGKLANFNFSVMVDDIFMNDVIGQGYKCKNKDLFNKIIENQWTNGEPSFLFYDRINVDTDAATPKLGPITATNPCGEQPLYPFESCNLGSINLVNFVDEYGGVDWKRLEQTIRDAVEFLDNVIDKNEYPIHQINEASKFTRKIGLGVMGFADMLLKMGIRYGHEDSYNVAEEVMKFIQEVADSHSIYLGERRGYSRYYLKHGGYRRRNVALTCIAPTGSISFLGDCSSGIEPIFSYVMKRKNTVGREYFVVHPLFEEHFKSTMVDSEYDELVQYVYEHGTLQDAPFVDDIERSLFVTTFDVFWRTQIDIMAIFQRYCDAGVSKTVNLPFESTKEDVAAAVIYAWQKKCKGVTLYRSGSRKDEVLTLKEKEVKPEEELPTSASNRVINHHQPFVSTDGEVRLLPKRPRILNGTTDKLRSGCGKLMITVNQMDGYPYETIINNRGGGCSAMSEALGLMISLGLRWNVPATDIVRTLKSVECPVAMKNPKSAGRSCANIIGKVLEEHTTFEFGEKEAILCRELAEEDNGLTMDSLPSKESAHDPPRCPECGEVIAMEEGCRKCPACGWSRC